MAGLRPPGKLTEEEPSAPVPADSDLGRCIQAELGDAPVLDPDLELVLLR